VKIVKFSLPGRTVKKKMFSAFTLVELMVAVTIIMILSTFVSINLASARKMARDNKRISDAQVLASALDQYAASHERIYPLLGAPVGSATDYWFRNISDPTIREELSAYINPVPSDSIGPPNYKYIYAYRLDGRKASIIITKFETGNKLCNIVSDDPNLPIEVDKYLAANPACYYVSR